MPKKTRPYVLAISGLDPSAGAGLLADIKTMEQCKVHGLGVVSVQTWQTHQAYFRTGIIDQAQVFSQTEYLIKTYQPAWVKIGLFPDLDLLLQLFQEIKKWSPEANIIWDPVLKASAGEAFHTIEQDMGPWLKHCYLITPNWEESSILAKESDALKAALALSKHTRVFLKGGHNTLALGKDYLFDISGKTYPFRPKNKKEVQPKHGSGCVLSSALTAYLAFGYPLVRACLMAKEYTLRFLESNETLLGYHKRGN